MQLQQKLRSVQQRKQTIRKEIGKTRTLVRRTRGDLIQIDGRLTQVQTQLEDTRDRLSVNRRRQRTLAEQLQDAEKQLVKTRQQVRERIRVMHEEGDAPFLSALVGTKSFGDLAERKAILETISQADRELFERHRRLERQVRDAKRGQDETVSEIRRLERRQSSQENSLEESKQEKKAALGDLRKRQNELEAMLEQFESDERAIAAQIAAYSRTAPKLPAFTGRFMRPVNARITSGFGRRFHPILRRSRMHQGVDFGARYGTSVLAAASGTVFSAQYRNGYGNTVMIAHGSGLVTLYGHLSRISVSAGQTVTQGQVIGAVGSTGLSTGPHLHWEVHRNGRAVNPLGF